jgi:hypothetical protein
MLKTLAKLSAGLLVVIAAHEAAAQAVRPMPAKPAAIAPATGEYHHWGLKGQSSPHNGWASYGHLTIDIGADRYFVYDQGPGEFSATVIDRQSENVRIRAVSIAGAGLFYFPEQVSLCQPDAVERLGLYAELLLFYLSAAAPTGPAGMNGPVSAVVDESVPELQFMLGVMKARQGARTLVTISGPRDKLQYVLHDDKDNIKGEWQPGGNRGVVPDNESLFGWRSCWAGVWSNAADGTQVFKPHLEGNEAFKTFGDVRKALRQKRESPAR